jgi:multisubunit Na+/H+ antiporter MnhB subunit
MVIAALMLSALLLYAIVIAPPGSEDPPVVGRIRESAVEETGATNLVSAIYLGYRAYDTLGEALVLLLAVTGVYFFARNEEE